MNNTNAAPRTKFPPGSHKVPGTMTAPPSAVSLPCPVVARLCVGWRG